LEIETTNPFLNFCVGRWVGGQLATNFSDKSKVARKNFKSFDTYPIKKNQEKLKSKSLKRELDEYEVFDRTKKLGRF